MKVKGLYRYPVQSVRGEPLSQIGFGPKGIPGDRAFAIADLELNTVAHVSRAKKNYRTLINWSARYLTLVDADKVVLEFDFADGDSLRSDEAKFDSVISARLDMPAALVRNDAAQVPKLYEVSPCHVLTTATLKRLEKEHPAGIFAPERFRPNILINAGELTGYVEQEWVGCHLEIGGLTLNVNDVCKRCALTTRAQGNLPDDPGILHATVANKTIAGVYAAVAKEGVVKVDDSVNVVGP